MRFDSFRCSRKIFKIQKKNVFTRVRILVPFYYNVISNTLKKKKVPIDDFRRRNASLHLPSMQLHIAHWRFSIHMLLFSKSKFANSCILILLLIRSRYCMSISKVNTIKKIQQHRLIIIIILFKKYQGNTWPRWVCKKKNNTNYT